VPTWQAVADDPTPCEAAMLAETVQQMLRSLEGKNREIVTLSLQGYTPQKSPDSWAAPGGGQKHHLRLEGVQLRGRIFAVLWPESCPTWFSG
jgi:hypothetical protein